MPWVKRSRRHCRFNFKSLGRTSQGFLVQYDRGCKFARVKILQVLSQNNQILLSFNHMQTAGQPSLVTRIWLLIYAKLLYNINFQISIDKFIEKGE